MRDATGRIPEGWGDGLQGRLAGSHSSPIRSARSLIGRALVPAVLLMVAGGCGAGRPVVPTDPDRARSVLEGVLSDWRDGATPADLRQRNPPVHVADERWLGGERIERFTLGVGEPFGTAVRIPADLTLASGRKPLRAWYIVTTEPAVSIVLAD